ncbi:MAG: PA2169 family four-helix-bundle protein [Phycisphaerales bacterium]|nr:PA2169 family four-helix-bundle protein [Phycisphaerales bacterium]
MDRNTTPRSSNTPGRDADRERLDRNPANRDPITDAPGAHPVGAGIGAGAGGAVGAAVGSVAGPVGTVAGAAIGGVAGGLVGKGIAEAVNPTVELDYWRTTFPTRDYGVGYRWEDFEPAYRETIGAYSSNPGWTYEEAEGSLRTKWERERPSELGWDKVRDASRDAWDRLKGRDGSNQHGASSAESADKVNSIIRVLNDSITGYRAAAEKMSSPVYRGAMRQLVTEREQFVAELKPLVATRGEDPVDSGSMSGAMNRAWMSLTTAMGGGDQAILNACERGEDSVKEAYEDVLDSDKLTMDVRDTISRQYSQARRAHDLVKAWRDQLDSERR